ncbi:MAG: hypothetical protein EA398_04680 [Deltaproteobacteria bacterium]|nr:MAG: hypothetical protein EA398_04680 [Deltaproteobacteria bacterium]
MRACALVVRSKGGLEESVHRGASGERVRVWLLVDERVDAAASVGCPACSACWSRNGDSRETIDPLIRDG